jgi:hypothetical protein
LGERLLCKQEVIGSIPFTSTILAPPPSAFGEDLKDTVRANRAAMLIEG